MSNDPYRPTPLLVPPDSRGAVRERAPRRCPGLCSRPSIAPPGASVRRAGGAHLGPRDRGHHRDLQRGERGTPSAAPLPRRRSPGGAPEQRRRRQSLRARDLGLHPGSSRLHGGRSLPGNLARARLGGGAGADSHCPGLGQSDPGPGRCPRAGSQLFEGRGHRRRVRPGGGYLARPLDPGVRRPAVGAGPNPSTRGRAPHHHRRHAGRVLVPGAGHRGLGPAPARSNQPLGAEQSLSQRRRPAGSGRLGPGRQRSARGARDPEHPGLPPVLSQASDVRDPSSPGRRGG